MGLYFSTTISCTNCHNKNVFNDTPFTECDTLKFIKEKSPRIICCRCGSDKISIGSHYFCSVDMTMDNSESLYAPQSPELEWILPDCQQRLPEVIYLSYNYGFLFARNVVVSILVNFKDFGEYTSEATDKTAFRRVDELNERELLSLASPLRKNEDMFVGVLPQHTHLCLRVLYGDMPEEEI